MAAETRLEGAVVANQLEVDAVEVGANGVEVLSTLLFAGELHAGFFEAEAAEVGVDFVFDNFGEDGLVGEGVSEFNFVVYNFH